eukprot:g8088.t1
MIGLRELSRVVVSTFLVCFALDATLKVLFQSKSARWYLIHAVVNSAITIMVIPDMVLLLKDPINGLSGDYSDVPLAMTVGMHVFHCVSSFKTLSRVDWIHHLVSNMLVCCLCFPFKYGPLVNWATFFVCGFPGGLDYYLLFFAKIGYIESRTEKRFNRNLNMWVRAPGIVMFVPFAWTCYVYGKTEVPLYILAIQGILNVANGLYFADRVVANHAIVKWCDKHNIDKKNVEQVRKILLNMQKSQKKEI